MICLRPDRANRLAPFKRGLPWYGLTLLLATSALHANDLSGVLHLANGDTFPGKLQPSNDQSLHWQADRFEGVFAFNPDYIDTVKFRTDAATPAATEPFRVTSHQGEVFHGKLRGVTGDAVILESDRIGQTELRRDHIREIRQAKHTQVLYDGPRWLDDWQVLKAGRRVSEWTANELGYLETNTYGAELFHTLPQLDVAEIHITLAWQGKPGFQIDFASAAELMSREPARVSLKSWSDDVVAQSALDVSDFQPLAKLTERGKELRLRLVWNNTAKTVVIYDAVGKLLGKLLIDAKPPSSGFGVLVKNRGDDLVLQQVRVSRWNGADPSDARKAGSSYVRLANGELITAPISSIDAESATVFLSGDEPRQLPLEQVAIIEFASPVEREADGVHLRFADGNEIRGQLESVSDTTLTIASPSSDRPLRVRRESLVELRFNGGLLLKSKTTDFSIVFDDGHRCSGTLAAATHAGLAGWQPLGSHNAVPLPLHHKFTIERGAEQTQVPMELPEAIRRVDGRIRLLEPKVADERRDVPDENTDQETDDAPRSTESAVTESAVTESAHATNQLIRLADGTALVGSVERVDEVGADIASNYVSAHRVPRADLRSIEWLKTAGRVSFLSPDWEFIGPNRPVNRSREKLEVAPPISMRDLSLEHGGRLTVHASWDESFVGLLTIHLGSSAKQPLTSIARFTFSRDKVIARCLNQARSRPLPPLPDRQALISVLAEEGQLRLWVNGVLAFEHRLTSPPPGRGLWLQCGSAKGPLTDRDEKPRLVLDGLRVGAAVDSHGLSYSDATEQQVLLQVPRDRKHSAPQNMLFAKNGDIVRGNLVAMTSDRVQFRSRLAELSFPREQVAAVTWLRAPTTGEQQNDATPTAEPILAMRDGSLLRLPELHIDGNVITGTHPSLERCSIPIDSILKIYSGKGGAWLASQSFSDWQLVAAPEPTFASGDGEQGIESRLVGQLVADVVLPMLDREPLDLRTQTGKVVILDFWATWCAPCIRSLPGLSDTIDQFPKDQVTFVAVNQEDDETKLQAFLEAKAWEFPVATDRSGTISRRFLVQSIPQTVVIAPDGSVARVFVGAPLGLHAGVAEAITGLLPK